MLCVSATAQHKLTKNYHGTTEELRSVPAAVAAKFLKKPCLREAFSRRDLKFLLLPNKVGERVIFSRIHYRKVLSTMKQEMFTFTKKGGQEGNICVHYVLYL